MQAINKKAHNSASSITSSVLISRNGLRNNHIFKQKNSKNPKLVVRKIEKNLNHQEKQATAQIISLTVYYLKKNEL